MPTPFGHALAAITVAHVGRAPDRPASWHYYGLAALLGCLPDIDLIIGLTVGNGRRFQHDALHSLAFAGAVAVLASLISKGPNGSRHRTIALTFCCVASHAVLDMMRPAVHLSSGVRLFWPFSERYFLLPVPILHYNPSPKELATPSGLSQLVRNLVTEAAVLGTLLAMVWVWRRRNQTMPQKGKRSD
jgi:membrane-bound metal-dependent hydrolase YbcI (DUF457 family)